MKHKRLKKPKANEWIRPVMKNYLMVCCDCGLAHWMDFMVIRNCVQLRARRAPKYTAQIRKREKIKVTL